MSRPPATIVPLTPEWVSALGDTWLAHRTRARLNQLDSQASWARPLAERRVIVERAALGTLRDGGEHTHALAAVRGDTIAAYLIGRDVRLPRGSQYRAYAPDHFLSCGADDWGVADPGDVALLADLYADLASWGLARGATAHLLAIPSGDDCADLWLDLGFARHDRYAFLPLVACRPAPAGITVRQAGPADLDLAASFVLEEAHHHHAAPIFAFAPPDLAEAKRRDMAESLANAESFVLIAEAEGRALGGLSAFLLDGLPFWLSSDTPTPCAYIDSAFVQPEARGHGTLRALVAALAERVAPYDARGLFVTYLPANRSATRAWQGLGFQPLLTIHQRRLDPRAVRQHRQG